MTRTRCTKCGKFMSAKIIAGCDPATGFIMTSDFSIHLCGQPRSSKGKFIRRRSTVEMMRPYQTYFNLMNYASQSKM